MEHITFPKLLELLLYILGVVASIIYPEILYQQISLAQISFSYAVVVVQYITMRKRMHLDRFLFHFLSAVSNSADD